MSGEPAVLSWASRLGRKPVPVPAGVAFQVNGKEIAASKGERRLVFHCPEGIQVAVKDGQVTFEPVGEGQKVKAMHGLAVRQVVNMFRGLSSGFSRSLLIDGVGYRAQVVGDTLSLQIGFTRPVEMKIPPGLTVSVEKQTRLTIGGDDRYLVGEFAARIRRVRAAEPYKGKGIRYSDEQIRRKAGKAAAGTGTGAAGGAAGGGAKK